MSDSMWPHRRQPTRLPRPWDSPGKNTGVGCHFLLQCMKVKSESEVTQSCPTLSDSMDCSLPGSSVHGIFQARVLGWVPLPSPIKSIRLSKQSNEREERTEKIHIYRDFVFKKAPKYPIRKLFTTMTVEKPWLPSNTIRWMINLDIKIVILIS